MVKTHIDT